MPVTAKLAATPFARPAHDFTSTHVFQGTGTASRLTITSLSSNPEVRPADYRPPIIPSNIKNGHGQTNSEVHQQQQYSHQQYSHQQYSHQQHSQSQYPPQQPWHQQNQHPEVQARHIHQAHATSAPRKSSKQQKLVAESAATALLPCCTADIPLTKSQVIALAHVASSLKELVLLALGTKDGDEDCVNRLGDALGSERAVGGIVSFFCDEFEIE